MNNDLMFGSATNEWYTPQDFYNALDKEFNFTLDPCATHENHKCDKYYTKEDDGLSKDWSGNVVFMNPPYSKSESVCIKNCKKKVCEKRGYHNTEYIAGQDDWIKKAYDESRKDNTIVVALLPVRTDKKVFFDYIYKKNEIRFIKGRLKFGGCKESAPFPSMVVIFKKGWGE